MLGGAHSAACLCCPQAAGHDVDLQGGVGLVPRLPAAAPAARGGSGAAASGAAAAGAAVITEGLAGVHAAGALCKDWAPGDVRDAAVAARVVQLHSALAGGKHGPCTHAVPVMTVCQDTAQSHCRWGYIELLVASMLVCSVLTNV